MIETVEQKITGRPYVCAKCDEAYVHTGPGRLRKYCPECAEPKTYTRSCRGCGADIGGLKPQQARYCSDGCREVYQRELRKKRDRRRIRRDRLAYIAARLYTCQECGNIGYQTGRGNSRKTCPDCLNVPPMIYVRNCRGCGEMFATARASQRNCREGCDRTGRLTCEWCGDEFTGTKPRGDRTGRAYCSPECLGADRRVKSEPLDWTTCHICSTPRLRRSGHYCPTCHPEPLGPATPITEGGRVARVFVAGRCAYCADKFVATAYFLGLGHLPKYCHRCSNGRKGADHNSRGRRAVRLTGAAYEPVSRVEVFRRDRYRCHICGLDTDPDAPISSDRYPSLDHVVPLSRGGDHTYSNIRCACFRCNAMKGDGDHEEGLGGWDTPSNAGDQTPRPQEEKKAYGLGGS